MDGESVAPQLLCRRPARLLTEPADEFQSRFQHRLMGEDQPHGTQAVRGCLPRGRTKPVPWWQGALVVLMGQTGLGCGRGTHHADHASQPAGTAAGAAPSLGGWGRTRPPAAAARGWGRRGGSWLQGPGPASVLLSQTRSFLRRLRGTGTGLAATPIRPETPEALQLSSRQQRASRLRSTTFLHDYKGSS